jgi:hypothetical protein
MMETKAITEEQYKLAIELKKAKELLLKLYISNMYQILTEHLLMVIHLLY